MKKILSFLLLAILITSAFTLATFAAEDAKEIKISISHVDDPVYYEGVTVLFTAAMTDDQLGTNTYDWWTVATFDYDKTTGGYKVTKVELGDGVAKKLEIPANGFVVAANTGNNWPEIFKNPDPNAWYYSASNVMGVPYKDCPNFITERNTANVTALAALKAGDIFYLSNLNLANPKVDSNADGKDIFWYSDNYETKSLLTSVKPAVVDPSESTPASSQTSSQTSSQKPTPGTSDNGIVAIAVIASLAIAGAVIVKKSR
ncbi:MAG: hypothetical protein RRY76_03455 [Clostridia bacterium]